MAFNGDNKPKKGWKNKGPIFLSFCTSIQMLFDIIAWAVYTCTGQCKEHTKIYVKRAARITLQPPLCTVGSSCHVYILNGTEACARPLDAALQQHGTAYRYLWRVPELVCARRQGGTPPHRHTENTRRQQHNKLYSGVIVDRP